MTPTTAAARPYGLRRAYGQGTDATWGSVLRTTLPATVPGLAPASVDPARNDPAPVRATSQRPPPAIVPPRGVHELDRTWSIAPTDANARAGCASHRGPPWIWQDKGNEDFAFALEVPDATGAAWVLAGVCDGVTQSPWSERGARHAAAVFIDVVGAMLRSSVDLAAAIQEPETKKELAAAFHRHLRDRLDQDGRALQQGRLVDSKFGEKHFAKVFLDGPEAAQRREWFQTTILASALGPAGGLALLMGDGYLRVDRFKAGAWQSRAVALQADPSKPERFLSTTLSVGDVLAGVRGVLPEDAQELRLVLATDGVSKSPENGLDALDPASGDECRRFLDALAGRGDPKRVDSDNMSVAFAWRRLHKTDVRRQ